MASLSLVSTSFLFDGDHTGKIRVANPSGLAVGATVILSSSVHPGRTLKIGAIDGINFTITDLGASQVDLSYLLVADNAKLTQPAQTSNFAATDDTVIGDDLTVGGRLILTKGTSVAAATVLTLGDGNAFGVTGNTQIDHITKTGWAGGSRWYLQFTGTPVLKQNAGSPPGTAVAMLVHGGADITMANGDVVECYYDGADVHVTPVKIVAGWGSSAIATGAIVAAKLGANAVETAKIDALAVTTAKIAALAVTTSEIATDAATGVKIAASAINQKVATAADASSSAQSVAVTGLAVGDKVVGVINITDLTDVTADFEATVTVVDEIQQLTTDLTAKKVLITVITVT